MQLRKLIITALFSALIAVGAQLSLPLGPVPLTLQIFMVMLAGLVLGSRYGAISVAVYMMLGIVGFPVFAGGNAGPAILINPTGGFLFGFVACAWVVGKISQKETGLVRIMAAVFSGLAVTYLIGLTGFWLSFKYVLGKAIDLSGVLKYAFTPFIISDLIKTVLAGLIGRKLVRVLRGSGYK